MSPIRFIIYLYTRENRKESKVKNVGLKKDIDTYKQTSLNFVFLDIYLHPQDPHEMESPF